MRVWTMSRSQCGERICSRQLPHPLQNQPCADSLPAPSIGSSTNFKRFLFASRLWVTRKMTRMFRSYLSSWTIFEIPSPTIRSVAIPNYFHGLFIHAIGSDRPPAGHVRSESQTDCKSPEWIHVNVSNNSTGSRSDSLQTKIEKG